MHHLKPPSTVSSIYRDLSTGGSCGYDPSTDLPNQNCVFVGDGDNSEMEGSVMAAHFVNKVINGKKGMFCKLCSNNIHFFISYIAFFTQESWEIK